MPLGALANYIGTTVQAIAILREHGLSSHSLVQIYAAIDTVGLLAADESIDRATSKTFCAWVDKYLIKQDGVNFTSLDLWSARCAVLHTFTTSSDITRAGGARELVYYQDSGQGKLDLFKEFAAIYENGRYVAVDLVALELALLRALREFYTDLERVPVSAKMTERLRQILQQHFPTPAP